MNRIGSNFPVKPVSKLSQLIIDYDKSWLDFGITELKELASGMQKGDTILHDGTQLVRVEPGPLGYFLFVRQPGNQLYWSLLQYLIKPAGIMLPTTVITDTEATLNAEVTDDEGFDCEGKFRYRELGGIWVETPWRNGLRLHDPFHEDLVGLTPATDYEAQCLLQCVDGVGLWSAEAFFTTLP